jgi:NADH-quinone oxidoreductase subunit J
VAEVLFFIAALGAIAGAVGVIALDNPFFSVLSLVGHLLSLAMLFLLLHAEFVAAAQVVVYAGAVMVLYVFVVAYIGGTEPMMAPFAPSLRFASILFVGAVLVELWIALLGSGLAGIGSDGGSVPPGFGSPEAIGELLLTRFLLAFELASILLLVAAVGAVVLARRRRGVHPEDVSRTVSAMDFMRPAGTGTMAEAASGLPDTGQGEPPGSHPKGTTHPEIARGRTPQTPEHGW